MEAPTGYSYQPLSTANPIRIITLLPGSRREQLKCTLTKVALGEKPTYEAISYVWGDEANLTSIFCDKLGPSLPITQNLAAALFRFRRVDKPRALWADTVCS